MMVKDVLYSFNQVNSDFIDFLSEENNKKILNKIKEYNLEFDITGPYENNDVITVQNIFSEDKIYIKCNEKSFNKIVAYQSETLYFTENNMVFNTTIKNDLLDLNGCKLIFTIEDNEQKIDFINSKIDSYKNDVTNRVSIRTEQVLKEKSSFILLKQYINKYNIDMFKIITGNVEYFKSLDETFDMVALETENKLLETVCNTIFNSFNIDNYKIERKNKNIESLFLFKKKKTKLKYYRMPMESKQLMIVLGFTAFITFLCVIINFLGFFV